MAYDKKAAGKAWYAALSNEDKAIIKLKAKIWKSKNPEKVKSGNKVYQEKSLEKRRKYWRDNKEKIAEKARKKYRLWRITRPDFVNKTNWRRKLHRAIVGKAFSKKTQEVIGCSRAVLIAHIESLFSSEMNWSNYASVWVIDHRTPCCAFDLLTEESIKQCFNYKNLQPLTPEQNKKKGIKAA